MRFFAIVTSALFICGSASAQDFADNVLAALPWNGQIQTVNVQTGSVTAVPSGEHGARAQWSPNGRYLVFMTGGGDTSMRLFDTRTNATRILGANLTFPVAWREDSVRLAMFHAPPTGKRELIQYGVVEKGISLRVDIKVMPRADSPMAWLPATDNVAYVGLDGNIYTVEEGEIKKITTSSDVIGMALTPDGKSLVWARRGPNPKYILVTFYRYDLTARSVRRIEFPGNILGLNPNPKNAPISVERAVFSPDGARVALHVTFKKPRPPLKPGQREPAASAAMAEVVAAVYSVRMDGTGAKQVVTSTNPAALTSFWSRDSQTLAVLRAGAPGNALIVSDAGGSNVRVVVR